MTDDEVHLDREELRSIVRNEIERNAILKAVEIAGREDRGIDWGAVLRHPITLSVFAFVLTAFAGVWVENLFNNSSVERAKRAALIAEVVKVEQEEIKTVDDLTELISRRWVASNLFRNALKTGDKEAIQARLPHFFAAYEAWNTRKPTLELRLRENLQSNDAVISPEASFVEREIRLAIEHNFAANYNCLYSVYRQFRNTNYSPNLKIDNSRCIRVESDRRLPWYSPVWQRLNNIQGCKQQLAVQLRRAIRVKRLRALAIPPETEEDEAFKSEYEDYIRSQCSQHANLIFIADGEAKDKARADEEALEAARAAEEKANEVETEASEGTPETESQNGE